MRKTTPAPEQKKQERPIVVSPDDPIGVIPDEPSEPDQPQR